MGNGELLTGKGSLLYISAVLLCCFWVLTGCGKGEDITTGQLGVEGYVYVAQEISWHGLSAIDSEQDGNAKQEENPGGIPDSVMFSYVKTLKVYGDSLFFIQSIQSNYSVKKLPIDEELDFSRAENAVTGTEAILCYGVTPQGGICWLEGGLDGERNLAEGALCMKSAEGEALWCTPVYGRMGNVSEDNCLALDEEGKTYLLLEDGIHVFSAEGGVLDLIHTQDCKEEHFSVYCVETLMEAGGIIYYIISDGAFCYAYQVEQGKSKPLAPVSNMLSDSCQEKLYGGGSGEILLSDMTDQLLYRYGKEGKELVLRWQDSGMRAGFNMNWMSELSPDKLLILEAEGPPPAHAYLLTRTRVEDLPQKEVLVLASLYPTENLQDFVLEFNKNSSRYHVVIERYGTSGYGGGAEYHNGIDEDGLLRLDMALASGKGPDLLDVNHLDLEKYAAGTLEDLFPYLERSESLRAEDFLGNVIEGYTLEGRLAAIPCCFELIFLIGRASKMSDLEGWSMEDLIGLGEKYPDCVLFAGDDEEGEDGRRFLVEDVCAPYYLEKFIDEEKAVCSFDSEEFRRLLVWMKECRILEGGIESIPRVEQVGGSVLDGCPEDCLLFKGGMGWRMGAIWGYRSMGDRLDSYMGFKVSLLGYPTVDGAGTPQVIAYDVLGITSETDCPEGAWEFLEAYLLRERRASDYLSPIRAENEKMKEAELAPEWSYSAWGEQLDIVEDPREHVREELMEAFELGIETADYKPWTYEDEVVGIISEETVGYFSGEKTLEKTVDIIQKRVSILLSERLG